MSGLRTRMYDIAKKVTMPPRISRPTVDPRSVSWKRRSSQLRSCARTCAGEDMGLHGARTAVGCAARFACRPRRTPVDAAGARVGGGDRPLSGRTPTIGGMRIPETRSEELPPMRVNTVTMFLVGRSEEHTSELQSRENLVCRLLL